MVTAHLIVQVGNDVHIVDLGDDPVTVGREAANTIRVDDRHSSRYHCRVEAYRSRYRLVDLGSQNGTRVNGKKVAKRMLDHGDRIDIGATVLYYKEEKTGKARGGGRPRVGRGTCLTTVPPLR